MEVTVTDFLLMLGYVALCLAAAIAVGWAVRRALAGNERIASPASALATLAAFIVAIALRYPATAEFLIYASLVIAAAGVVAWIFREILRRTMPETIAKPMRQAPLTAAFGILVILTYVVIAVGAPAFAPYGEAEVFEDVANTPPSASPSLRRSSPSFSAPRSGSSRRPWADGSISSSAASSTS